MSFRRIAIYPNMSKPHCARELGRLITWLKRKGIEVRIPATVSDRSEPGPDAKFDRKLLRDLELLVVLGGDGTLLSAARMIYPRRIPILGVNFGGLGFLADVTVANMFPAIEKVLRGEYRLESRMMLRAAVLDKTGKEIQKVYGLNDMVLHEAGRRAIVIEAALAGTPLGAFRADGVIVATPTGSTAYSLSAGGPIVQPTLNVLIATPISPHSLSIRPLVFPAGETMELRIRPPELRADLTVDGQVTMEFDSECTIQARRAERSIDFVLVEDRSFYDILRAKLRWGGV